MEKASEWLLSFNSSRQEKIQALIQERKKSFKKAVTVSFTGGKGGVGKTSIALKFAKELANQGHKTLLVDCDYNLSNTAIRLGLPLNNSNFYSLLTAEKSFEDCLHIEGDFHLLSACNGDLDLFDSKLKFEELIVDIINGHEDEYDFIMLDCPAGLSREALILNAYCDQRIFVVTPDKASITDSYSLMKVLSAKFGVKENHLLVNMHLTQGQFQRVALTISETVENFLGCRTNILGGLKRIDVEHSRFDKFFLHNVESGFHKKFLKVVKKYSDDLSRSLGERNTPSFQRSSLPKERLEQEVQTIS
ncbi:MAG: AAA family ATPase [Bacteriovoracaceae bacterium]